MASEEPDNNMTSISDQEQDVTRADGQRQSEERILGCEGSTLDERYQIISLLGKGGMSVVYKARHLLLDRLVAVKMLLKGSVASHESLQRFQYEAKAISQLQHTNIIQVYAFNASDVGVYLVMDYLEGISLDEVLREEKRVPIERALPIFKQAAAALEHAHAHGIVHRDLKPSNIMLVQDSEAKKEDVVKLVDFGIAKLMPHEGEQVQQLTRAGAVFGTPAYMSPEQCTGQPLDARSDIYSFGSVMFEIMVGQPPLEGETPLATMYLQLKEKPPLLSEAMPGQEVSIDLERIIDKCLEKDPDNRFQNMSELVSALDTIRRDSTTIVRVSQQQPVRKKRHHHFNIWFAVIALLLAVAGGFVIVNYEAWYDGWQIEKYNSTIANKNSTLSEAMQAHSGLVPILEKQNKKGDAIQHLKDLAQMSGLPDANKTLRERFDAWFRAGDYINECQSNDDGEAFNQVIKLGEALARENPADDQLFNRLLKVIAARIHIASEQSVEEQVIALASIYNEGKQPNKALQLIGLVPVPEKEDMALKYLTAAASININARNDSAATTSLDQALKRSRNTSERASVALNAATMFSGVGASEKALYYYDQALSIAKQSKNRSYLNEMVMLEQKATLLLKLHRGAEARRASEDSLAAWKKTGIAAQESSPFFRQLLLTLGNAQYETKDYTNAAKTFAHRLEILLKMRATTDSATALAKDQLDTLRSFAESLKKLGAWAEAAQVYDRALWIDHELKLQDIEAQHDREHCENAHKMAKLAGQKALAWRDIDRKYLPNLHK